MQTDDCCVACSNEVGGVGKTMLTAAVIRDDRVREAFQVIAWLNMSQKPDLLSLQKRLYQQIHPNNEELPKKAKTIEASVEELLVICAKRVILITLDGAS